MIKNLVVVLLFLVGLIVISSSCASIINGGHQDITVFATPSDASISVDGITGSGRVVIPVKRGATHIVEVKKDGYKTVQVTTGSGTAGWYFGNIIFGGIIGEVIDLITGAAYSVNPDPIIVSLDKGDGPTEQRITPDTATLGIVLGIVVSIVVIAIELAVL